MVRSGVAFFDFRTRLIAFSFCSPSHGMRWSNFWRMTKSVDSHFYFFLSLNFIFSLSRWMLQITFCWLFYGVFSSCKFQWRSCDKCWNICCANQRIWMYISVYFRRLQRGNNSIKNQHNENNNIALLVQFRYFSTITVFADNTWIRATNILRDNPLFSLLL